MKVSIITVVFNAVDTIEHAVLSVGSQSYRDIEHIVIDGGSTDGTLDILRKHQDRIAILLSEPDGGIYDAMNKGIALSTGDIIGILNSDDFYAGSHVIAEVAAVFADANTDVCYADLVYVDRQTGNRVIRYCKSQPYAPGLFARGWCPPHPTFFARKSAYAAHGSYDLSFALGADVELMMRFLEARQVKSKYVPRLWVQMRLGGTSNKSLRNIVLQNIFIARAARIHKVNFNVVTFLTHKIIDRMRQRFARPGAI